VGVQHIDKSKAASKAWIPRPTVRVPDSRNKLVSKQLTLAYCDRCGTGWVAARLPRGIPMMLVGAEIADSRI
jgi:hypothetical protein